MYAYDNIENKIPLWASRGYVVCVATAKQSVQVHVREKKVNSVKNKISGDHNITTKYQIS